MKQRVIVIVKFTFVEGTFLAKFGNRDYVSQL